MLFKVRENKFTINFRDNPKIIRTFAKITESLLLASSGNICNSELFLRKRQVKIVKNGP